MMSLEELAKELGVSKSTVSRALSGKGRIGETTRKRIIELASQYGLIKEQQEIGEHRTKNIGVVLPADVYANGIPYFQDCLLGICEVATLMDYNVLITTGLTNDISNIKALVENQKVDGIILTRKLEEDKALEYLISINFPVGITGICDEDVIQVDMNNEAAAENLTSLLIGRGYKKFALIVEDFSYHVNRSRYDGFCSALLKNGLSADKQVIYTGSLKVEFLDTIISEIVGKKVECIVCGDDVICTKIISRLQAEGYQIPRDIAVASYYNSPNLNCFSPPITAVNVSARQVGNMIGKQMIHYLQGREHHKRTIMDYEILFRKSTN